MRLLVCASAREFRSVREALDCSVQLSFATGFDEALALARAGTDRILCGAQFDESRMLDLLAALKADARTRSIPCLCVRAIAVTPESSPADTAVACQALGAVFIDLEGWRQQWGRRNAAERLQTVIRQPYGQVPGKTD